MLVQIKSSPVTAVLIAQIQDKQFCFDINDVKTIINPNRINSLYRYGKTKKILYDSAEIQIVDLASIFHLEYKDGNNTRIIVLNRDNQSLAFFVEEINELISFNYGNQERLRLISEVIDNPYLIGKVYVANRSFLFPNVNQLFSDYSTRSTS